MVSIESHLARRRPALKKATTIIRKVFISIFAPACATIILTSCGGSGPEPYSAKAGNSNDAKASMSSAVYNPSSSGLNSSGKFDGFNPSIWNEHMSYECNCGINPNTPPQDAPQGGVLLGNRA
jgi:hypothetical protein